MSGKLQIEPVYCPYEYYCSENSVATLLGYYKRNVDPRDIHDNDCYSFSTIGGCLPKKFKRRSSTIIKIRRSIKNKHPVLVSVIPDLNIKENPYEPEVHTILIYGYSDKNILSIDDGVKKRINYINFKRIWKRTNNDTWILEK